MNVSDLPRFKRKLSSEYRCWQNTGEPDDHNRIRWILEDGGIGTSSLSIAGIAGLVIHFDLPQHQVRYVDPGDWITFRRRKDGSLSVITYTDAEFRKRYEAI